MPRKRKEKNGESVRVRASVSYLQLSSRCSEANEFQAGLNYTFLASFANGPMSLTSIPFTCRYMMFSSENKRNSIRDVLFDAAVQLSVPAVASTASAASQMRSHSTTDESVSSSRAPSPASKSRFSLPFESTHASRHSDGIVSKVLRDVATQASPVPSTDDKAQQRRPSHLILDNNNNQTTTSSISATSKEYLSVPQHAEHRLSAPVTPLRRSRSFKMALLDMWQGLNSDELRSTASSPMDPKYVEDRLRLVRTDESVGRFQLSIVL